MAELRAAVASFEVQGLWWLPEHGEHRVPGVLSWDSNGGGSLKLVGQLRPVVVLDNVLPDGQVQKYRDRSLDNDHVYPVVWGLVERTAYTLLHAFQRSRREWSLDQSTETVHANAVLEGAWVDGPEVGVDRARFRLRDLAGWVDVSGLEVTHPCADRTGDEFAAVTADQRSDVVVRSVNPRVSLNHRLGVTSNGNETITVQQDWVLHLDHDEVSPLQTFVEVASDFQDLVSIATGRTAEFRSVVLQHPEVPVRLLDGTARDHARQNLTYHAQWTNRVDHSAEGAGSDTPMSSLEMYLPSSTSQLKASGVGSILLRGSGPSSAG